MSFGPIPNGRFKNVKDVDKWSSLSLCLSVRGNVTYLRVRLYLYSRMGHKVLPIHMVVHGNIALSKMSHFIFQNVQTLLQGTIQQSKNIKHGNLIQVCLFKSVHSLVKCWPQ